jgi:hypothetical protein
MGHQADAHHADAPAGRVPRRRTSENRPLSLAELIRRAIDATYRDQARPTVAGFELSVGAWRRPDAAVVGRRTRTLFRP